MASAVEQWHDDAGIVWPVTIAPFQVILTAVGKNPEVASCRRCALRPAQRPLAGPLRRPRPVARGQIQGRGSARHPHPRGDQPQAAAERPAGNQGAPQWRSALLCHRRCDDDGGKAHRRACSRPWMDFRTCRSRCWTTGPIAIAMVGRQIQPHRPISQTEVLAVSTPSPLDDWTSGWWPPPRKARVGKAEPETPFKIAVLGDFSGRQNRGVA